MNKYQLTADELFLIKLIFYAQNEHEEYLNDFFSQNSLGYPIINLLKSIQEKGIINKSYKIPEKGTIFNPKDVEFNKLVLKSLLTHSQLLGQELFDNYPMFVTINGKQFSLRNIAKKYKTFDEFCWEYGKAIKFDIEEHNKILNLIEWGKENNTIHSGICDFIISKQWETLQTLKDEDFGTFNTNELI